ncbi:MAG TPA: hypothetical protein VFP45_06070 [Candidatus Nitrosotalea sp.]|nr:hypothetical protein [Candidatus Nitrosotalea sp.]
MENIRGGVIGHIFGGQSMECYRIIIGSAVVNVINIKINRIKLNESFRQITHDITILNP